MKTLTVIPILLCAILGAGGAETKLRTKVYVSNFVPVPEGTMTSVAAKFTEEFEEALGNCGEFEILERRNLDSLIKQAKNEQEVMRLFSSTNQQRRPLKGAKALFWGKVEHDVTGGEVNVRVTWIEFDGTKRGTYTEALPPARRDDPESRREAMARLAKKFCQLDTIPKTKAENEKNKVEIPSNDFPGFGKPWQFTLEANGPKRGGMGHYKEFSVRVAQSDRLRVQLDLGGASMKTHIEVLDGTGRKLIEKPRKSGTLDWTMTKGIPGESARVKIYADPPGKLTVLVSKAE